MYLLDVEVTKGGKMTANVWGTYKLDYTYTTFNGTFGITFSSLRGYYSDAHGGKHLLTDSRPPSSKSIFLVL